MTPIVDAFVNLLVIGLALAIIPLPIVLTILSVASLASGTWALAQDTDRRPLMLWFSFLTLLFLFVLAVGTITLLSVPL